MASAILSRESFNNAVEKALETLKDSSIESLTKYQPKALFHVLNGGLSYPSWAEFSVFSADSPERYKTKSSLPIIN